MTIISFFSTLFKKVSQNSPFLHQKVGNLVFFSVLVMLTIFPRIGNEGLQAATSQVTMQDGRILTGEIAPVDSVAIDPSRRKKSDNNPVEKIVVIDDQLRQIYVPKNRILDIQPDELGASMEIFKIRQPIFRSSAQSAVSLGSFKSSEPFDENGRRTIYFGATPLVQGITEITPRYVRVQGINLGIDMRISPHAFERNFLTTLIKKGLDPKSLPDRLRIYLFYTQAELFEEAAAEIREIIQDFQDDPENTEQLSTALQMIQQLSATRLIDELQLRRSAGQHRKVRDLLTLFNAEGVSSEKSRAIRKLIQDYEADDARRQKILDVLTRLNDGLTDEGHKAEVEPILEEIRRELNPNTTDRFSEFLLSLDDASVNDEQRLAIGLSGWFSGNAGVDNRLEIALSMFRLRHLVRKYLLESTENGRDDLWEKIRAEEAATPIERPARIIQRMKPPRSTPASDPAEWGFYRLEIPSFENGKTFSYCVQLPPEYDPNRKYPTIVTLHSERTTPELQIDWWAGSWKERTNPADQSVTKERYGQGARFGYIVVAPRWSDEGSPYRYSARETAAVLYSLRDAERRFSIDTDRVFLTGHSAGADAVWDLGLSHPDLWAGIVPICGQAVRYASVLRKNAEFVPVYAVNGELDGGKVALSRGVFDKGMNISHPYDMTCVIFRGRGNESLSDEVIRIFDWMRLRSRNFFFTEKRTVFSMRPWDSGFWQAELEDFPEKTMILPFNWTEKLAASYYPARTEFLRMSDNSVKITSMAKTARVGLSPEVVDFNQRVEVFFNGKKISPPNGVVIPALRVLLEDARTRADRQHPFWAVFDSRHPGATPEDYSADAMRAETETEDSSKTDETGNSSEANSPGDETDAKSTPVESDTTSDTEALPEESSPADNSPIADEENKTDVSESNEDVSSTGPSADEK